MTPARARRRALTDALDRLTWLGSCADRVSAAADRDPALQRWEARIFDHLAAQRRLVAQLQRPADQAVTSWWARWWDTPRIVPMSRRGTS